MPSSRYTTWVNMKARCDNPNRPDYKNYGGRGIIYDPRWALYKNFAEDMGAKPAGLTLERVDNNGNYCKANCIWTTRAEQSRNRRQRTLGIRTSFNPTQCVGVSRRKRGNFLAYVNVGGKRLELGSSKDLTKAINFRKEFNRFWNEQLKTNGGVALDFHSTSHNWSARNKTN